MQNREARCASQVRRDIEEGTLEKFFEHDVRVRLTAVHVFGAAISERMSNDKLIARCPVHGSHECLLVLETLSWVCPATKEHGGPLEFVQRQLEATGVPMSASRVAAIAELALRCDLILPSEPKQPTESSPSKSDAFWSTATASVLSDAAATRWLERHGLNAAAVESYDLVRVVARGAALPDWAGFMFNERWCSWPQAGHRVVVPVVSSVGSMCGALFCSPIAKSGVRVASSEARAFLMADPIACHVLSTSSAPGFVREERFAVVVASGVISFLRHVTGCQAPATTPYRAVFGLVGGALDPAFLTRLPMGTHLISAVERGGGGDRVQSNIERLAAAARRDFIVSRSVVP
jgi:hypothetical protein